jgi:hypothetical protein
MREYFKLQEAEDEIHSAKANMSENDKDYKKDININVNNIKMELSYM